MTSKLSLSILFQAMSKLKEKNSCTIFASKKTAARGVVKVKARTRRDGNQHVSAKAWRFQNNLFHSVHSCAAWPQFSTAAGASSQLGFDTRKRRRQALYPAGPASRAGVDGVEKLLKYQTMKMSWGCREGRWRECGGLGNVRWGERGGWAVAQHWINIRLSWPVRASPTWQFLWNDTFNWGQLDPCL